MKILYNIFKFFLNSGIDFKKIILSVKGIYPFLKDLKSFKKQTLPDYWKNVKFNIILSDRFYSAGTASGHYFNQDLFVAQEIFIHNPKKHYDIGSRIDGFVSHVASFRQIKVFDIRGLESDNESISFVKSDLMNLNDEYKNSTDSISSLHALEHFGLGRYGDSVDIEGFEKGFTNILEMLKNNGRFYFSVPIGPQRIEFNAHRVFDINWLKEFFNKKKCVPIKFAYINDEGKIFRGIEKLNNYKSNDNFNCSYGTGIFILKKLG